MRRLITLPAVLTTLALVACGPGPSSHPAFEELPPGVQVDVYQTRTDLPARKLEISIANGGQDDLVIVGAVFDSPQFVEPARWNPRAGGTLVRTGFAVDLPVALPAPACEDPNPVGTIRLMIDIDGRIGTAEVPVVDRFDRLSEMRAEECYAASVETVAALSIDDPIRIGEIAGAPTGFVPLSIAPTGAEGSFSIDALEDTVLLALRDPTGLAVEELPLGLVVDGADPPSVLEIPILPGRCDPHAIAEDKQGTIFVLDITAPSGETGRVRIATAPTARASIYAFFAEYCGLPH